MAGAPSPYGLSVGEAIHALAEAEWRVAISDQDECRDRALQLDQIMLPHAK